MAVHDSRGARDVQINLRASRQLRDVIDRAAAVQGKTRSEFMLDSARRQAEDVLLDQRLFLADDRRFVALQRLLAAPPKPAKALRKLLAAKSPWER